MTEAIKLMWWALGTNVAVALMNLWIFVDHVMDGQVSKAIMSALLVIINCLVAAFLYHRIQQQHRWEKQRVADILSGRHDDRGSGWQI